MTTPNGLVVANTVTVDPGATPTTLLTNMPAGTQILNLSTSASIWISDNQSITPGQGYELGPQGSCVWQYDKQACYACVDTGVLAPVNVTFGNSVSDIQNPVFVAEALAILGIPNVLLTDVLIPFGTSIAAGGVLSVPGISKYASLLVYAFANNTNTTMIVQGAQLVTPGNIGVDTFYLTQLAPDGVHAPAGAFNPTATALIPVSGQTLQLNNLDLGNAINIIVIGSNRPVTGPRRVLSGNAMTPRSLINATNTNAVFLTAFDGGISQLPDWTSYNGPISVCLNPGVQGILYLAYRSILNGFNIPLFTVTAALVNVQTILTIQHPFVNCNWLWITAGGAITPVNNIGVNITAGAAL